MIPKKHKFSRRYFEVLMRKMKSFRHEDFLILYRPSERISFAVVISKKVTKKAVERNRFRRQMYSLLEEKFLKDRLPLQMIILYKGRQIPDNTAGMEAALEDFKAYYLRKHS